jgi:hypothetical protein
LLNRSNGAAGRTVPNTPPYDNVRFFIREWQHLDQSMVWMLPEKWRKLVSQ